MLEISNNPEIKIDERLNYHLVINNDMEENKSLYLYGEWIDIHSHFLLKYYGHLDFGIMSVPCIDSVSAHAILKSLLFDVTYSNQVYLDG
jgi:hypothetical protein